MGRAPRLRASQSCREYYAGDRSASPPRGTFRGFDSRRLHRNHYLSRWTTWDVRSRGRPAGISKPLSRFWRGLLPSRSPGNRGRSSGGLRDRSPSSEHGERENDEADPGKQQRDPDDDAEDRKHLRHESHVERGRESCFRDPRVAGAVRDRLAVLILRGCGLVVRPRWIARILGGLVAAQLRVCEPAAARQRVLAHDLCLCERLPARVDRFPGPLLCMFLNGRISRWAERDSFALDVVACEAESPDAEDDHDESEDNQYPARDVTADSQKSALFHCPLLWVGRRGGAILASQRPDRSSWPHPRRDRSGRGPSQSRPPLRTAAFSPRFWEARVHSVGRESSRGTRAQRRSRWSARPPRRTAARPAHGDRGCRRTIVDLF